MEEEKKTGTQSNISRQDSDALKLKMLEARSKKEQIVDTTSETI